MRRSLKKWLRSGPNRIALSTAWRGTIAAATPLVLLPPLGLGDLAYPAVLGALATSMVDVGGPYRSRLVAMLIQALGGACLLLLGGAAVGSWWTAALVMAAIGIISGMIRALGPGGASLGINAATAFLVGLQIGEIGGGQGVVWAEGYAGGGLWTVLVALAFWQLRPYRRLEQEVASAWEAVAALVAAIAREDESESVVARRRREQVIARRQAASREAIERAREALGEMRAGTAGPGTTIAQLVVLLNAASRVAAAAVTLGELAAGPAAETELRQACHDVAHILLAGKGELSLAGLRQRLQPAPAQTGETPASAAPLAWAQALRHLDNAEEALRLLFGRRRRLPDLLRLPFAHRRPRGAVVSALRANASPRSAIFRHALRVAAVTALDAAIVVRFRLPHGIWLPLTSLVILQPDYAGTLARALQRTAGTIAGAAVAGALLAYVHGSAGYDAAIGLLLFATFLLIRRRYGYAITFLTPLIILLIGMSSADPWIDLAERVAYTIGGAALALAAGYLLWPQWEREQLRERLARAIGADQAFVAEVLAGLARLEAAGPSLASLRRQAELAIANADAGFQRMLAEPTRRRAPVAAGFALLVYAHRLCRHAIALSAQLGAAAAPAEPLHALGGLIERALSDAAQALLERRAPAPRPGFDAPLARLTASLAAAEEGGPGTIAASLLARIVSDVTGLLNAAAAPGLVSRERIG
ncbi:MAG TPA: FUSC family protein [Stellaceae bacterium]|nr:FUSC family protein [Stellaceae bacterium]